MSITSGLLPAGVVFPYSGSVAPKGWLLCDGSDISITTYADLYAAIGTTYNLQTNPLTGAAYGAPTGFRIPDYRGIFLRGVGNITESGYEQNTTLAGFVKDQAQGHQHEAYLANGVFGNVASPGIPSTVSAGSPIYRSDGTGMSSVDSSGKIVRNPNTDCTNGTPRVGKETRPLHVGVNYIIKY